MIEWMTLHDVILGGTKREKLQQGWSPQCEAYAASEGEWGVLKTTAIQAGHFLSDENKRLPSELIPRQHLEVKAGDLLLTCAGPRSRCGVPTLVKSTRARNLISGKMYRFRSDPSLMDPLFLQYYLLSPEAQRAIDLMKTGISESGLNLTKDRFLALPVPVMALAEQARVVERLEDHLSRLDVATEYLRRSEQRSEIFADATIVSALGNHRASMIPLDTLLAEKPTNGKSVPTRAGGFPVLRLTAMKDGVVALDERKEGAWTASEASPFRVRKDDVFVARGNGSIRLVGRAARVLEQPDDVAYPDTMIRIRVDTSIIRPDYFVRVWNSRAVRRQIEATARTTAGIYKVNQGDLRGIQIPFVPLAQQGELETTWRDQLSDAARVLLALRKARRRAASLRRSVLTSAFSEPTLGSAA